MVDAERLERIINTMEFFIPDHKPLEVAFKRATHLGIGAHQDDLEIMAFDGILQHSKKRSNWFFGIVVTDGSGSVRSLKANKLSDDKFREIRNREQKRAASIGRYSGVGFLNYKSGDLKKARNRDVQNELGALICRVRPSVIYTHNLADKHDTHVAVALRTIEAIRELPKNLRPKKLYGCEVWRDLDWLSDQEKVAFDVSGGDDLAFKLLAAFKSQSHSGKRYDLATLGRRKAHATYSESHRKNRASSLIFAMDLTPLITNPSQNIQSFLKQRLLNFEKDVLLRINRL